MYYKTAVLINLSANNGRGQKRWRSIERIIKEELPKDTIYIEYHPPYDFYDVVKDLVHAHQVKCFISVGGDGSVNLLINTLFKDGLSNDDFRIGAIGIGSSNDFCKPNKRLIKGIPIRINYADAIKSDVGLINYLNIQGEGLSKYFIINSSIGFTAEGNYWFNKGDFFINLMKNKLVLLTIIYTALKTFWKFKNLPVHLEIGGKNYTLKLTNLNVLKKNYISGNFKYPQKVKPNDSWLGVNYCFGLSKFTLLKTLIGLMNGKFSGNGKFSTYEKELKVKSSNPIIIEADGETFLTTQVDFKVLPEKIYLLS